MMSILLLCLMGLKTQEIYKHSPLQRTRAIQDPINPIMKQWERENRQS